MLKTRTSKFLRYDWIFSLPFIVIGWLVGIIVLGLVTGWMWAWKVSGYKTKTTRNCLAAETIFDVLDKSVQLCIASRIAVLEEDIESRRYWEGSENSLRMLKKVFIEQLKLMKDV